MLWNLGFGWFIMAFGTVAGISYMLSLLMESSIGKEGYGPFLHATFITGGFFLGIVGANHHGIDLSDLRLAVSYGGAGSFALMLFMLLMRALANRLS